MDKILVEIYVPAAHEKFDVLLPKSSKMGEIINLVATTFSQLLVGKYKKTKDALLCDANTGDIYDVNQSVQELHIQNGAKLMLI